MTVKVVQTTQVAAESLADICDTALGYPRAGVPSAGGSQAATPSTWNSWGAAPHAWTRTASPIWFTSASDCWYELSDATAAIVAASGALSAGQKAAVSAVLAGRVDVADPSQAHVRIARFRNRRVLRVLCDGDSWVTGSTAGFHSWRTQLQILAQADPNCPGLEFVGPVTSGDAVAPALNAHNGVNGTGIASHNGAALATNLATYYPDVYILFLGTNDAGAPIVVSDYTTVLTTVHSTRPACGMIWTTQPDLFAQPNLANFIAAIPGAAASLISGDPTLAGRLVTHNFTGVITVGDTSSSHPTAAGYDLLAASLWPKFKTLIGI